MHVKPVDRDVKNILETGFYIIPRFQRPYSWERENIEDFWNDAIYGGEKDYFIGSMVAYMSGTIPDTFYLVDGQQRLTTITIFLAALRDLADEYGRQSMAKALQNFVERDNIDGEKEYCLKPETSYPFFQEYVQRHGDQEIEVNISDEEKSIGRAYHFFLRVIRDEIDKIKSKEANTKEDPIKKYISSLRDRALRLEVIFIELDNEDDAYIIFETLNTRGKDLEVSDLVKNHIMRNYRAKNNVDVPHEKWQQIRRNFVESEADINMNAFILHYWLSKYDFVAEKKLFKELKNQITRNKIKGFLDDLVKNSRYYRSILEPDFKKWEKEEIPLKESLQALNIFRVRQQVPMTLSILREYEEGALSLKQTKQILRCIESFHFIFTAVTSQRSSGGISQMYSSAARGLSMYEDKNEKSQYLRDFRQKLRDRVPEFDEFEVYFREIRYTEHKTKQKALVRYILAEISKHESGMRGFDFQNLTIEHLAPQNPEDERLEDDYVGMLGNMILVSEEINGRLANKSFEKKKKILIDEGWPVPPEIRKSSKWTGKEIVERNQKLANLAYYKIWSL